MDGFAGRLRDQFAGRDGQAWAGSVEDLLYEGESVRRTVSMDGNRVVVTSHRLLAFTPDLDGENYHQVDLPNVSGVRAGYDGESNLVYQSLRALAFGVVLLGVGLAFDFGSIVPTDAFAGTGAATGRLGLGGLFATMQSLMALIAQLDEIARAIGALLLLFSVFVTGVYMLTRTRVVVVSVAGDQANILVPAGDATDTVDDTIAELESVLFDSGPAAGSGHAPGTLETYDPDTQDQRGEELRDGYGPDVGDAGGGD